MSSATSLRQAHQSVVAEAGGSHYRRIEPIEFSRRAVPAMKFQELLILLPCHSLEDFPTYHEGDDAQSLLASWSALWHPALLAAAGKAPTWRRIEDPPSDLKDKLIVVPSVCVQRLPTGFAQRCKEEGGLLIRKTADRAEIVAAALAGLGSAGASPSPDASPFQAVDAELAADFLALGYSYLQIELLTRQMRYSSNLDETYFKNTALAAAVAAVEGDTALAQEKLSACFSVLAEERDHYYPVDAFLIDLNMVASTTLGPALREELSRETPTSVLLSGELVEEMAAREPDTLSALKAGLEAGRVGLAGGAASESRWPLLSHESILEELRRGLAIYERLLGRRPEVFGRWRYGHTPHLPGILHRLGFRGALHASFDEGKTPDGLQIKVRWEGLDGSAIDALARTPLDATKPQTFLSLATKMGESMDGDHVATLCLAHWPGQASPWLDDLRRIARYSSALGKFVTLDQFFRDTAQPGQLDRFEADRYRSPYLKQAIIRKQDDPLSTPARYWEQQTAAEVAQTLDALATLVSGKPDVNRDQLPAIDESNPASDIDIANPAERLAAVLTGPAAKGDAGLLVINPCSFVRRIGLETEALAGPPTVERPVYAADQHSGRAQVVVDVPPLGFVHLVPGKPTAADKNTLLLVEDNVLRNEFFEAVINTTTGTLSAVHEYKSRGNRLSQQLALRQPGPKQKPGDTYRDPDESAVYSVMAADSVETTIATTTLGEIVARGRLLDQSGKRLAGFVQTYRIWRGSRVLHVEIELDPAEEPKTDPWNSYYCARLAWADEGAELFRTQHLTRQPCTEKRIESSHYLEIEGEKHRTAILTGGLMFHRRHEHRMLDTLLISRGEGRRKFRLGIGVDLAHPLHEAIALLAPPVVVPGSRAPSSGTAGWLLHLGARNVVATCWQPIEERGRIAGFRVRLLETEGRPANFSLAAFRAVKSAETVDFLGQSLGSLGIEDGKIKLDLAAYEWVEVVARW
jgi:alpha-mannosidase